jgi:hypothetical protein
VGAGWRPVGSVYCINSTILKKLLKKII